MSDEQKSAPKVRQGIGAAPVSARVSARTGLGGSPVSRTGLGAPPGGTGPGASPRSALGAASDPATTPAPESESAAARPVSAVRRPLRRWLLIAGVLIALAVVAIVAARMLIALPAVDDFLRTYPGRSKLLSSAPVGVPAWLGWQHFLNAFFIVLIIKTGWQVRRQRRPPASWLRDNSRFIHTKNPPHKISITLWLHLSLDGLWFANGVIFVVLLFVTGQWMRIVPTTWDVVPNALSAALQYASLQWPTEDGWVNYNSLQLLAYFVTVFLAAPLAAVTGIRMSGAWPQKATQLNRVYPIEIARAVHFPVMIYFVLFVIAHVGLVFATGALRNLNHMYGGQDAVNWTGAVIFAVSLIAMAGAWVAARPIVVTPIASLFGKVSR